MNEEFKKALIENGYDFDGVMDRLAGSEELYEELLQQFLEEDNLTQVLDDYQNRDYEALFMKIHTLKGVAGNLGLTRVYEESSDLTEKLRAKDYTNLQFCVDALEKAYTDCIELLKMYLKK